MGYIWVTHNDNELKKIWKICWRFFSFQHIKTKESCVTARGVRCVFCPCLVGGRGWWGGGEMEGVLAPDWGHPLPTSSPPLSWSWPGVRGTSISPLPQKGPGTRGWRRDLGPETGVTPTFHPPCGLTNKLKILPPPILRMRAVNIAFWPNQTAYNNTYDMVYSARQLMSLIVLGLQCILMMRWFIYMWSLPN